MIEGDEQILAPEPPDIVDTRQLFDEERAGVIGSTDSAGIIGLSRRATPLSVYRRLVGEAEPSTSTLPAWIGSAIENVVAELAAQAIGEPLRADNLQHLHPHYPFIGAHLDRRVVGRPRTLVELKTRSRRTGWGEDGSADIPVDVFVQVQHQMACTDADEALVATLFGLGHGFAVYRVPRDDEFLAELIPKLVEFWETYVVPRVPPPATGWDVDTDVVKRAAGGNTGFVKPATAEHEMIAGRLRLARINYAQALLAKVEMENRVRQIIGPADGLAGSFGTIWYKRTKERHVTAWELLAGVYKGAAVRLLELAAPGDDDVLVAELASIGRLIDVAHGMYTEVKPGIRQLRVEFREDA